MMREIGMNENQQGAAPGAVKKRFGWAHVVGFILVAVVISVVGTILVIKSVLFPSPFKPVTLNPGEEKVLSKKLEQLDSIAVGAAQQQSVDSRKSAKPAKSDQKAVLEPEPYSEQGAPREIRFSERELNALLAKNTDLASKLAIDLSDDLVSAKLLLPVDEDFPVLGGQTIRVRAGVALSYRAGKPVVILKGISVMGVPIPNAWMGGIKNIDLVKEFGSDRGFWKTFAEGIEEIKVDDGVLKLKLKK